MTDLFLKFVNMSISASWIVLVVLVLRLFLKKAPKWLNPVLWGIVGLRLMIPISIESVWSLIPSVETISPDIVYEQEPTIHSGVSTLNEVVNPIITEAFAPEPTASVNPLQIWIPVAAGIWIVGMIVMLAYAHISYLRLKKRVQTAVWSHDNIYRSENVSTPFVLGILRPRIYLPFDLNEKDMVHVIAHEQTHIRRRDHWIKPISFLLITIYWFNPVLWIAYILLSRDIELACDEGVIKELGPQQRADYSEALLSSSISRSMIAKCPLAFGEVGVKERVKNVLSYKKPAFWIILVAIVATVFLAICFLTNPEKNFEIKSQRMVDVTLSIPKDKLPDSIYERDGHNFEDGEVVVYQTSTTTIYLTRVCPVLYLGGERMYFTFDFSYQLPEKGEIVVPYTKDDIKEVDYSGYYSLKSSTLTDDTTSYPDAVEECRTSLLLFSVSTDACRAATGTMKIETSLWQVDYNKEGLDDLVTVPDGYWVWEEIRERLYKLTLDDVIRLAKKGEELDWSDFDDFYYVMVSTNYYERRYDIDDLFYLSIRGKWDTNPDKDPPMDIRLYASDRPFSWIDIRETEDVEAFIEFCRNNPPPVECSFGGNCSPVGYSQDVSEKMLEISGRLENTVNNNNQALPIVRIDNMEDLEDFIEEMEDELDCNKTYEDTTAFSAMISMYKEEFFEQETLFLIYVTGAASNRYSVEYVRKQNSALSIGIKELESGMGGTESEGWIIAVSVPIEQISEIHQINADISSQG